MEKQTVRKPTSVGEIIRFEYLDEMGITANDLASLCRMANKTMYLVTHDLIEISSDIAAELAYGTNSTPEFWMNLQKAWIDWHFAEFKSKLLEPLPDWVRSVYPIANGLCLSAGVPGGEHYCEFLAVFENTAYEIYSLSLCFQVMDGKLVSKYQEA